MQPQISPIFSVRGDLSTHKYVSKLETASPWQDSDVSFHWSNFDYPRQHIHEYWEILVLISGRIRHCVNGRTSVLTAHQACLLRPNDCHAFFAADDSPVIILNFMAKKEYMTKLLDTYGEELTNRLVSSEDLSFTVSKDALNKCIADTQFLQIDTRLSTDEKISRSKLLFIRLLSELMMQNVTITGSYPQWLSDFLLKLSHADLSDLHVRQALMNETPYSYSRLIYLFKQYMGCTIVQYISYLRVERAKEYLKYTNRHMIDIASLVGCDNVTHFNRIFKAATGMPPSRFRKENSNVHPDLSEKKAKK